MLLGILSIKSNRHMSSSPIRGVHKYTSAVHIDQLAKYKNHSKIKLTSLRYSSIDIGKGLKFSSLLNQAIYDVDGKTIYPVAPVTMQ